MKKKKIALSSFLLRAYCDVPARLLVCIVYGDAARWWTNKTWRTWFIFQMKRQTELLMETRERKQRNVLNEWDQGTVQGSNKEKKKKKNQKNRTEFSAMKERSWNIKTALPTCCYCMHLCSCYCMEFHSHQFGHFSSFLFYLAVEVMKITSSRRPKKKKWQRKEIKYHMEYRTNVTTPINSIYPH